MVQPSNVYVIYRNTYIYSDNSYIKPWPSYCKKLNYRNLKLWRDILENLDKINRKILNILQDDCSITNNELAKRVGLAPATTLERVRKLENRGILLSYVAQIKYLYFQVF